MPQATPLDPEVRARLRQDFCGEPLPLNPFTMQVGGAHYASLKIQPAYFSEMNGLSFLEGSIIKRVCRYQSKNGKEDLEKAIHEIQLLISIHYGDQP